jgi:predicted TIM-barrel fold metal-dependent hydrolase
MLCTYFYNISFKNRRSPIEALSDLLYDIGDSKVLLMHGGSVRLMEVIEIVRSSNNALLDLSFTLCKYEGSSVDLDIQYAFKQFDRKICIGSDYPQFELSRFRKRFEQFSSGINKDKAENIAFRNISEFIKNVE